MLSEFLVTEVSLRTNVDENSLETQMLLAVLTETYNPRHWLWGAGGVAAGALVASSSVKRISRMRALKLCTLAALYSNEVSWSFRDPNPARSFCENFSATNRGKWLVTSQYHRKDSVPAWILSVWSVTSILFLDRTLGRFWSLIEPQSPGEALAQDLRWKHQIAWVLLLQPSKFSSGIFQRSYWRWKESWLSAKYDLPQLLEDIGFSRTAVKQLRSSHSSDFGSSK